MNHDHCAFCGRTLEPEDRYKPVWTVGPFGVQMLYVWECHECAAEAVRGLSVAKTDKGET